MTVWIVHYVNEGQSYIAGVYRDEQRALKTKDTIRKEMPDVKILVESWKLEIEIK